MREPPVKQIFKPTLSKIILTLALFSLASLLWRMYVMATLSDTFPVGFPLQFFLTWGPCRPEQHCAEFNGLWLILDLLFWYAISAGLVAAVHLRRSRLRGKFYS